MHSIGGELDQSIVLVAKAETDLVKGQYVDAVSKILTTMLVDVMNPLMAQHPHLVPSGMTATRKILTKEK